MTAWSSVVVPSLWRAISARPRACRSRGSADRLGRSPATIKAYFYDPTAEKARAEGALCRRVPRLRRVYPAAQREGRRVRVLHGLPSRRDPGALEAGARAGSDAPGGPAVGWLTSTSATPIRVRRRTSTSGSLLRVVQTGSEVGADEGGCSPTRARARCACSSSRIRPAASTPATPAIAAKEGSRCGGHDARSSRGWRCALLATSRYVAMRGSRPAFVSARVRGASGVVVTRSV
jgi:hypothetical protein